VAVAYREDLENGDPHEEIVHLEEQIDELAAKIESCRKFILASRIAVAGGGVVLAAMLVGAIRSDLGLWQRRSPHCSEALLYGVQIVAQQKRRRRNSPQPSRSVQLASHTSKSREPVGKR
jgi:hypothetical protein